MSCVFCDNLDKDGKSFINTYLMMINSCYTDYNYINRSKKLILFVEGESDREFFSQLNQFEIDKKSIFRFFSIDNDNRKVNKDDSFYKGFLRRFGSIKEPGDVANLAEKSGISKNYDFVIFVVTYDKDYSNINRFGIIDKDYGHLNNCNWPGNLAQTDCHDLETTAFYHCFPAYYNDQNFSTSKKETTMKMLSKILFFTNCHGTVLEKNFLDKKNYESKKKDLDKRIAEIMKLSYPNKIIDELISMIEKELPKSNESVLSEIVIFSATREWLTNGQDRSNIIKKICLKSHGHKLLKLLSKLMATELGLDSKNNNEDGLRLQLLECINRHDEIYEKLKNALPLKKYYNYTTKLHNSNNTVNSETPSNELVLLN